MSDPSPQSIQVQLFTISDTRQADTDESGAIMTELLRSNSYSCYGHRIVREEPEELQEAFSEVVEDPEIDVVISSGGTGISGRDQTLETVRPMLDKELPGFGELFRHLSYEEVGPYTVLSRATAGRSGDTLVVVLPGSPSAVKLALEEILMKILPHMVKEIRKHG